MAAIFRLREVHLSHEARFTASAASGAVAALSPEGVGSLISADFQTVKDFTVSAPPRAAALSPAGSELAIVAPDGIRVFSTATSQLFHRLIDAFLSCLYVRENLVWTCARFTPRTVVLKAWDPRSWTPIAQARVADPYGNSEFSLFAHPDQNSVVLWAAAGQDGQCLLWATLTGSAITVTRFRLLSDTCPPSFSPNGEEFLVTSGCKLRRYAYPKGPLKGSLKARGSEDEDDAIGYSVSYIDAAHAVVTTIGGRLLLVSLEGMSVIDEVAPPDIARWYNLFSLLPLPERKIALVYTPRGRDVQRNSLLCLLAWQEV
jgi:hypothetical protein